jgi:hypothetical protein
MRTTKLLNVHGSSSSPLTAISHTTGSSAGSPTSLQTKDTQDARPCLFVQKQKPRRPEHMVMVQVAVLHVGVGL